MEQSEFYNSADGRLLIGRTLSGAPTAIEGNADFCSKFVEDYIFPNNEICDHYPIRLKVECDNYSSLLDMMRQIIASIHPKVLDIPNPNQNEDIEFAKEDTQEFFNDMSQINNEIAYHTFFIEYLKQLKKIQYCPLLVLLNFDAVKLYFHDRPDEFMKIRMFSDVFSLIICSSQPIKEIEIDSCGVSYLHNQFITFKI